MGRLLSALMVAGVLVVGGAGTAVAKPPTRVTLSAKLLDAKVKVNGKARVQGRLEVGDMMPRGGGFEAVVVQRLDAGVWVDVQSGQYKPNLVFKLSVSFSLAAEYTLRLYHPQTALFAEARSDVFVLAVIP